MGFLRKKHKQYMNPSISFPPLHQDRLRFRSFPLETEVGPLDRSDAYEVRDFHVQWHLTAANE